MLKITVTGGEQNVNGYEGAFYRFTTDDGRPSAYGIWDNWYEGTGKDDNGNEYFIVWSISKPELFAEGDEDCCDWDNPVEVIDCVTGLPVAEYELIWR